MAGLTRAGKGDQPPPASEPTFSTPSQVPPSNLHKEGSSTLSSSGDGEDGDIRPAEKVDGDTGQSRVRREELRASDLELKPLKRKSINGQKAHLKGRFSGRLETKDDEKRLVEECRLAGPLLGGIGKRGERSRMSLAKIVRGLATGEIRSFLEAREAHIKELTTALRDAEAQMNELKSSPPSPSGLLARVASQAPSSSGGGSAPANKDFNNSFPALPPLDASIGTRAAPVVPEIHLNPAVPPQAQEHNKHAVLLQQQALNFQAHADHLGEAVKRQISPSTQSVVQAQKYLAKARSLEAAAVAHSLQARAVVHAESRVQMEALAQDLAQQAEQQRLDLARAAEHQQQQASAIDSLGTNGQELHREFVERASQLQDNIMMLDRESEARKGFALEHLNAQENAQADAQSAVAKAQQLDAEAKSLDEKEKELQLAFMTDALPDTMNVAVGKIGISAHPSSGGLLDMRDREAEHLQCKRKLLDVPEPSNAEFQDRVNPMHMAFSRHMAGHVQNTLEQGIPCGPLPGSFC